VPHKLSAALRNLAEKASAPVSALARTAEAPAEESIDHEAVLARDEAGRIRVKILLDGTASVRELRGRVEAIEGATVTPTNEQYRAGVIEAFVPEDKLIEVAKTSGIVSVVGSSPAVYDVGAAVTQGVVQHRVD